MVSVPSNVINMRRIDGIIVTVTGYTYNPGLRTIKKSLSDEQYKDFQIYMAVVLAEEIVRGIDTQRYITKSWPPLSISYKTWKKTNRLSLNIWEATGYLKSNVKIFRKGSFIGVGFKQKDLYPKSFLKVNQVARWVEYGTIKMPPRPLFRPILLYMRKNVSRYYKKYQKVLKDSGKEFLYLKSKKVRGKAK